MESNDNNGMYFDLSLNDSDYSFGYSIESALSDANISLSDIDSKLEETVTTIQNLTPECDKLDYALAISSGAVSGIVDIFLVATPGDSLLGNLTDKWFADRTVQFANLCGWDGIVKESLSVPDTVHSAIEYLEKKFKIPYDQVHPDSATAAVLNITPNNHHFKSLSHNPSLCGLFFAVLDQFAESPTSHFVSDGRLITMDYNGHNFALKGSDVPSKLFCAFVNWVGHLISDNSGSSGSKGRGQGIPSPLWTWMNDVSAIKGGLNLESNEFEKEFNELACNMFEKGYDARFQTAQAIPVFINELVVRLFYSTRRLIKYFSNTSREDRSFAGLWKSCEPFSNATVKRMLTVAHGAFCLLDVGEAVGQGFAKGGGYFNVMEFAMRVNLPGLGRFGVSLLGEANRGVFRYE